MIEEAHIEEILRMKGGLLFHREGQTLEFKEQYNFAGLAEYFRDFAAFANNKGGHLIFGVTDSPRTPFGLSEKSLDAFNRIDPEKISGFLLELFSSNITWEQAIFEFNGKQFGVFRIFESETKPVIARKNEGRDQAIKNGEIYYRYGGRTQLIQSAELENIIARRIERVNKDWIDHVKSIGVSGPGNALILKSEKSLQAGNKASLVVDEALARKIKFIKEGQFNEKQGATTLKLVGDVSPVDTVEVEKVVKENLFESYPLSAMELCKEVSKRVPSAKQHEIWRALAENGLKGNPAYSAYNFRNKKQEEEFETRGIVSNNTPIIYNEAAADLLENLLKN